MPRTLSENRPPSTVLWLALNWRGGSRRNCTTTKTSAHSPVGPGERALVSHLRENRNEEQIAITVTITASFALRALCHLKTQWAKAPALSPTPAVTAPQATFPKLPEPAVLQAHGPTQKLSHINKEITAEVLRSAPAIIEITGSLSKKN